MEKGFNQLYFFLFATFSHGFSRSKPAGAKPAARAEHPALKNLTREKT
jgi:hypothetical protein